jgi:hypothetical protein
VLFVINSENPKKCKRYKQLVLKSSKCINCTEVKRHSANHVVLTLTPEVNIVGINYLIKFVQFCCEISIGFAVPHSTVFPRDIYRKLLDSILQNKISVFISIF